MAMWPCAVHVCVHVRVRVQAQTSSVVSECVCVGVLSHPVFNRFKNNFMIVCGCIEMCCMYARNPINDQ